MADTCPINLPSTPAPQAGVRPLVLPPRPDGDGVRPISLPPFPQGAPDSTPVKPNV